MANVSGQSSNVFPYPSYQQSCQQKILDEDEVFDPLDDEPEGTDSKEIDPIEEDSLFRSFECPIYMSTFKNPVVDECGHTFEEEAIMKIYQDSVTKQVPFLCPLSKKILDPTKFVKNFNLASAQEEVKAYVQGQQRFEVRSIKLIQHHERERDLYINELRRSASILDQYQKKVEALTASIGDFQSTMEEAGKVIETGETIAEDYNLLRKKFKVREDQLRNFEQASLLDRTWYLIDPSYSKTISGRVTETQRRSLSTPTKMNHLDIQMHQVGLSDLRKKIEQKK